MRRSFVNSIFNRDDNAPAVHKAIRANVFSTAATIAELNRDRVAEPGLREFWHRLAGSLRKAAELQGSN